MEKRIRAVAIVIAALAVCCAREPEAIDHVAEYRAAALERRRGVDPFVYDRFGNPLALNGDFRALTAMFKLNRAGRTQRVVTTLDPAVQHAANLALGDLRGSLVAIDPRSNEVLAVATTGPDPFIHRYEPGSVIKTLTLLAALSNGVDVREPFPYECKGWLDIDGRHFGDWHPGGHGSLPDLDEALAESCNVVFAGIGLKTGRDRLRAFHQRAGFDSEADLGLFKVPLGNTVGPIFNDFETGFYAIGLEHEQVTPFHLAVIATMLANRGAFAVPRLYRERRSIPGVLIDRGPAHTRAQLAPPEAAERVVEAMEAVVTRPKGTGRRAEVEGVSLAMKTGTAGKRDPGYDALIAGFAPADRPAIAFAIIAEHAGAAEFAGAKAAHDFVSALRASGHL